MIEEDAAILYSRALLPSFTKGGKNAGISTAPWWVN